MSEASMEESFERIFGGLPSTWPTATDDAGGVATDIARKHAEGMAFLNDLAAEHGGGLIGIAAGVLTLLERRQLITANDRRRLDAVLQAFKAYPDDPDATLRQIRELEDDARRDHASTATALSMLSVASAGVADAASTESRFHEGQASVIADLAGIGLGSPAGPLGSFIVGVTASSVAAQTVAAATE